MRKYVTALLGLLLLVGAADARPRHYHRVAVHPVTHSHQARDRSGGQDRPADCYGIAWCGCWLRHQFGLKDTGLNAVSTWRRYPQVSPQEANVVIWPGGRHVGKVLSATNNTFTVISGNSGGRGVNTWTLPIKKGFSFHRV